MTGERLYMHYVTEAAKRDTEFDPLIAWPFLAQAERDVWDALAALDVSWLDDREPRYMTDEEIEKERDFISDSGAYGPISADAAKRDDALREEQKRRSSVPDTQQFCEWLAALDDLDNEEARRNLTLTKIIRSAQRALGREVSP